MKFIIVTGMSGSGKTVTLKLLEDYGYYCADNLPVELIGKFVELLNSSFIGNMGPAGSRGAAIGIDIRSSVNLLCIENVFNELDAKHIDYKVLYLDADIKALIKRYKETRRSHPLARNDRLETGIEKERIELKFLKERADYVIDTSRFLSKDLRAELIRIFIDNKSYTKLFVNILSFGFMYGIPDDADLVFDVRFLPNPFYEEDLRLKTGEDEEVKKYVFSEGSAYIFLTKLNDIITFLLPLYIKEGKSQLVIAIGCTGGQHRSVAIATSLSEYISSMKDLGVKLEHRDIHRNISRLS